MIFIVCAVHDRKVDAFGVPIFVRHSNEAIRSFGDQLNDGSSYFGKHPGDFDLFQIGTYDDDSGHLLSIEPRQLALGSDMVSS